MGLVASSETQEQIVGMGRRLGLANVCPHRNRSPILAICPWVSEDVAWLKFVNETDSIDLMKLITLGTFFCEWSGL